MSNKKFKDEKNNFSFRDFFDSIVWLLICEKAFNEITLLFIIIFSCISWTSLNKTTEIEFSKKKYILIMKPLVRRKCGLDSCEVVSMNEPI